MAKTYFRILSIAGSDSGGGAGIQADLKTFAALGCYGTAVVTALTAQNTEGVKSIHEVPKEFVAEQMKAVLEDIGTDAIKIGMLHNSAIVETVAQILRGPSYSRLPETPLVLDPVMLSKNGDLLLNDCGLKALKKDLCPLATVITPNIPEAEVLIGRRITSREEMERAAIELFHFGSKAVVLKGGHLKGNKSPDCVILRENRSDDMFWLDSPRIETKNSHGTGCTFSSAIAAFLARGDSLKIAIQKAKYYLTGALAAGKSYELGRGHGPLHHFYETWTESRRDFFSSL